jgi:hypothetical protein
MEVGGEDMIGQNQTHVFISHPEPSARYAERLKMATTVFAETLENLQHSIQLLPESQRLTLNFKLNSI